MRPWMLVPAAAVIAAGCGGDVPTATESPAPLKAAAAEKLPSVRAPKASRSEEAAIQRALERDRAARGRRERAASARRARAARRRAEREQEATADRVATEILHAAGFEASTVEVTDRGRAVRMAVSRDSLCEVRSDADPRSLGKQLRAALPFVRRVTVSVQGTGAPPAEVRAACGPQLEANRGEVFLEQGGSGTFRSGLLDVTAKRWSIDYASDGSFLEILVFTDGRVLRSTISGTAGATGSRTFDGYGTYRVRVAGDGRWVVRVRAGG